MTGTVLATILATLVSQFALGGVLLAAFRLKRQKEAAPTQKRRSPEFVTTSDLEERLKEFAKQQEWVMDEWYEKFSTLHARLAKRQQRAQRSAEPDPEEQLEIEPVPSVVHLRRLGSV